MIEVVIEFLRFSFEPVMRRDKEKVPLERFVYSLCLCL